MDLTHNEHILNISKILKHVGERVEGNLICDIHPDNWTIERNIEKIRNLQSLVVGKRRVMEIGINACHSLILMLLKNPTAEYLLFDLNNHAYTQQALDYVRFAFPDTKITAIFGNSVETIPYYLQSTENIQFDLCHLDGGHTHDVFSHDYANVRRMMEPNGYVIFDDYDMQAIREFIDQKLRDGEIYRCEEVTPSNLQFVYRYA